MKYYFLRNEFAYTCLDKSWFFTLFRLISPPQMADLCFFTLKLLWQIFHGIVFPVLSIFPGTLNFKENLGQSFPGTSHKNAYNSRLEVGNQEKTWMGMKKKYKKKSGREIKINTNIRLMVPIRGLKDQNSSSRPHLSGLRFVILDRLYFDYHWVKIKIKHISWTKVATFRRSIF